MESVQVLRGIADTIEGGMLGLCIWAGIFLIVFLVILNRLSRIAESFETIAKILKEKNQRK
ncbi:MAG TPA: hypothetical protein VFQ60_01835 [Patescibacteria group bacterium]|nr:hypothetical protein [Patescibacteria group bacterium]